MIKLQYKLILENNVEYVFDKLFEPNYYKQWTKPFNSDSTINGNFGLNNEVYMIDSNNDRVKALITQYEVNKIVEFTYISQIENGVETKFENSRINYERYRFKNLQGKMMMLDIKLCIPKEYEQFFATAWEQVIEIIQDIFDNNASE